MKVVDIQPRDIFVLMEFSLKELCQLDFVLDNMTVEYDRTQEGQMDAALFLTERFAPAIKELIGQVREEDEATG